MEKNIFSGVGGRGRKCNKSTYKPILQTLKCETLKSQLSRDSELCRCVEERVGELSPLLYSGRHMSSSLNFDQDLYLLSHVLIIRCSYHTCHSAEPYAHILGGKHLSTTLCSSELTGKGFCSTSYLQPGSFM